MRELSLGEVREVGGAGFISGIGAGLRFAGVVGVLYSAYKFGYGAGTYFNSGFESVTGQSPGTAIYNFVNGPAVSP